MGRFGVGAEREQTMLFPPCLEVWIAEDSPVRVVDAFVDALDTARSALRGGDAARTNRPGYHPAALLNLYVYGYLNRVPSSRRLEREAGRKVEVMWLTGHPDCIMPAFDVPDLEGDEAPVNWVMLEGLATRADAGADTLYGMDAIYAYARANLPAVRRSLSCHPNRPRP